VSPAEFEAWLAKQRKLISEANAEAKVARAKLGAQPSAEQIQNP
jgi:hypothetical protein